MPLPAMDTHGNLHRVSSPGGGQFASKIVTRKGTQLSPVMQALVATTLEMLVGREGQSGEGA